MISEVSLCDCVCVCVRARYRVICVRLSGIFWFFLTYAEKNVTTPSACVQTSLYKLKNGWLSSLKRSYFSSWKADILLIHAGFSLAFSVCDWERKMDLNVTHSKNLPDHDSHCLGALYPTAYKIEGSFSHSRLQKARVTAPDQTNGKLIERVYNGFANNRKKNE